MSQTGVAELQEEFLAPGALIPKATWKTAYRDPFRFDSHNAFKALMLEALAQGANDVLIQPHYPIVSKVRGRLLALTHRGLDDGEIRYILKYAAGRDTAVTDIVSGNPVNTRFELFDPEIKDSRGAPLRRGFRLNASPIQCWGGTSAQIVLRVISQNPPRYTEIGLTRDIMEMMTPLDGLVYVAGKTNSGKTTTFASTIRYILEEDTPIYGNIITHEEPIEFAFDTIPSRHSIVVQSQIPTHFKSFDSANREAMRRTPDLIMIGEMRDEETIRASIEASKTGHPVYGTLHCVNVPGIFRRLISRFPTEKQASGMFDIIETARFAMAQRLVIGANGERVAAREYLQFDEEVRKDLLNLNDMGRVTDRVSEFLEERGHSFVKEARRLLEAGLITEAVAREVSRTKELV